MFSNYMTTPRNFVSSRNDGASKKNDYPRTPDFKVSVDIDEELEIAVWSADADSRNAGALYGSVYKTDSQTGKPLRTFRLANDDTIACVYGFAQLWELLSVQQDSDLSNERRDLYRRLATAVQSALASVVTPHASQSRAKPVNAKNDSLPQLASREATDFLSVAL